MNQAENSQNSEPTPKDGEVSPPAGDLAGLWRLHEETVKLRKALSAIHLLSCTQMEDDERKAYMCEIQGLAYAALTGEEPPR